MVGLERVAACYHISPMEIVNGWTYTQLRMFSDAMAVNQKAQEQEQQTPQPSGRGRDMSLGEFYASIGM